MHSNGWIPREQILGTVAKTRVPEEFLAQHPTHANPPALLFSLERLFLEKGVKVSASELDFLKLALPRLQKWFDWIESGQRGERPGSYYWRGRDTDRDQSQRQNPRTLSSGLDDYPRSLFATTRERHVDLACWIAKGAEILAGLSALVKDAASSAKYTFLSQGIVGNLTYYHWDESKNLFADWGKHADLPLLTVIEPITTIIFMHARKS